MCSYQAVGAKRACDIVRKVCRILCLLAQGTGDACACVPLQEASHLWPEVYAGVSDAQRRRRARRHPPDERSARHKVRTRPGPNWVKTCSIGLIQSITRPHVHLRMVASTHLLSAA